MKTHYDYIIAGAGCSGLSLLMHILQHPQLSSKSILLADNVQKKTNDRTWCFWEKGAGLFEPIVHQRWNKLRFHSNTVTRNIDINPYQYKMIRGIDFYEYCFNAISAFDNIEVIYGNVTRPGTENGKGFVEINGQKVTADFVFNSITAKEAVVPAGKFLLLQHFKGWLIQTDQHAFNPSIATLMDFRKHEYQWPAFFYVLPVSATEALVEFTVFSQSLLNDEEYSAELRDYISQQLNIGSYRITHEEFGVIPMTNKPFSYSEERVVNIGSAGGAIKASTGYAFRKIQQRSQEIVDSLLRHAHPFDVKHESSKFHFYDSVFLHVLDKNPQMGERIFSTMFSRIDPQVIFRFLDNESTVFEDLRIMRSLFSGSFIRAGIAEAIKKARH